MADHCLSKVTFGITVFFHSCHLLIALVVLNILTASSICRVSGSLKKPVARIGHLSSLRSCIPAIFNCKQTFGILARLHSCSRQYSYFRQWTIVHIHLYVEILGELVHASFVGLFCAHQNPDANHVTTLV